MKSCLVILTCVISSLLHGQNTDIPQKISQKGFVKGELFQIMVADTEALGHSGVHSNLFLNQHWYMGAGFYGSLTGIRGGFITFGTNIGYQRKLTENIGIDASLHFGGGGGAGAPDGGGAYIVPQVSLNRQIKELRLGLGYSYINFFDGGNIESFQWMFSISSPFNLDYADFQFANSVLSISDRQWDKIGKRIAYIATINNYYGQGTTHLNTVGDFKGNTARLVGLEIDYIQNNNLVFIKSDGAYAGIPPGYMDLFLGIGKVVPLNTAQLIFKMSAGTGGGGGVDSQGGMLFYPEISYDFAITNQFGLSLKGGYITSPNFVFRAYNYGIGLKYMHYNGNKKNASEYLQQLKLKGYEVLLGQEKYFGAERTYGGAFDLQQIYCQINYFINRHWYLGGKTGFANFGNAGAYAEGLIGLGYSNHLSEKLIFALQIMNGAGGGGHIATGNGLVTKPSIALQYNVSKTLGLRTNGGYMLAPFGEVKNPFLNIGLSYRIALLNAND